MRRTTRPDSPKAMLAVEQSAMEVAEERITGALQVLADALSNEPTPETVTQVQLAVKQWTKRLEDAEKISKALLIEHLKTHGTTTTDKGSLSAVIGEYQVEARPWRSGLDSKKVESLLRAKELSVDTLMDKEIKYAVNESRLAMAVAQGQLSSDEVLTCKYELSYALQPIKKVSKS